MKVLSKFKKWINTSYTGLLIRVRDYLNKKFPIIEISTLDNSGCVKKNVAIDLETKSYVTEVFHNNRLVKLDSRRFDFINSYRVRYDDYGRRMYTLCEDEDTIFLNHIGVQVNIGLYGYNADIQIKPKGKTL